MLAQSLLAARHTIDDDRPAHSLHGYFILAGDLDVPVVYFVDRLRDGRSYVTRRVTAIQHGEAIFNMSSSFHRHEEGVEHQMSTMRDTPPPEGLKDGSGIDPGTSGGDPRPIEGRSSPRIAPSTYAPWIRASRSAPNAELLVSGTG